MATVLPRGRQRRTAPIGPSRFVAPAPRPRPASGPQAGVDAPRAEVPPLEPAPHRAALPRGSTAARAVVIAFLLSLIIPISFNLGPMRLTPYRLFLLGLFVPLFVAWAQGRAGRIRAPDWFMLAHALWGALTLLLGGAGATAATAGIFVLETFGAYLLARVLIRDRESFAAFARAFVWMVILVLLPVGAVESFTGRQLLQEIFRAFGESVPNAPTDPRFGLDRAQGPFPHPILFGVFCASAFGLALLPADGTNAGATRIVKVLGVSAATFLSLSTGPYLPILFLLMLYGWDRTVTFVPKKWNLLGALFVGLYVVLDLIATRNPIVAVVTRIAMNAHTAYFRVQIWNYGIENVWAHPLFGLGLGDWARPSWMPPSVDNFWLLVAMRHGIPGVLTVALVVVMVFRIVGRAGPLSAAEQGQRKALLFTLTGVSLAICTVHIWNAPLVMMMFLLGSGLWMADATAADRAHPTSEGSRP